MPRPARDALDVQGVLAQDQVAAPRAGVQDLEADVLLGELLQRDVDAALVDLIPLLLEDEVAVEDGAVTLLGVIGVLHLAETLDLHDRPRGERLPLVGLAVLLVHEIGPGPAPDAVLVDQMLRLGHLDVHLEPVLVVRRHVSRRPRRCSSARAGSSCRAKLSSLWLQIERGR